MQGIIDFLSNLDLQHFLQTSSHMLQTNPLGFLWWLFSGGGWILFALPAPFIVWFGYMNFVQGRWHKTIKYELLAIDIPKENEQSIKAVEQMFFQFWTIYLGKNLIEKYIKGMFQLALSFEIVSIDGYVQFLVRTPRQHRDHVEAAIYAQYPDAVVTEIEDYTEGLPTQFPNDTYKWWGTEFVQVKNPAYPIRTYPHFEHQLAQKITDPMAATLEAMSKLQKGEQVWIQFVCTPLKHNWHEQYRSAVNKLIGAKKASKPPGFFRTQLAEMSKEIVGQASGSPYGPAGEQAGGQDQPNQMLYLTPGERNALEGMEIKLSKPGFAVKMRVLYVAEIDKYAVSRGIGPVFGGLNQFTTLDMNAMGLGKHTTTHVDYFFEKTRSNRRRRLLMANYKGRSQSEGEGSGMIMNTEELASLYHFPVTEVAAPGVSRIDTKRVAPPDELPEEMAASLESVLEDEEDELASIQDLAAGSETQLPGIEEVSAQPAESKQQPPEDPSVPPSNLPF